MFNGQGSETELFECECQIDPKELQVGHFVSRLDRPWRDSPFPLEGVLVQSDNQREWFVERCKWIVIDLLRSRNGYRPPSARTWRPAGRTQPDTPASVEQAEKAPVNMLRRATLDAQSISSATDCHDLLYRQAAALIDSLRRTGRINTEEARLGLRQIAGALESNIAAMIWLTRIHQADEYTAEHSVNVAILAMGLARALEWGPEQVEHAGLAGLLHDIGKLQLDEEIVNKPDELTEPEMQYLRSHSEIGYDLLRTDERVPPEVARAVHEHHEQPDGGGYPAGKTADELLPLSKLLAVVNAYDAMTAHWPYRQPLSHHEALGELWRHRRRQFDEQMVEQMIRFLGWVTPGTLVRLSNGEHAVVLQSSHDNRLWPVIRRLKQHGDRFVPADKMDLSRQQGPARGSLKIEEVLPDGAIEVDLHHILLQEAMAE
ncbi:MAG: HD-GYP domain-containing protein [Wenzhouxiangellaceae bacterium]